MSDLYEPELEAAWCQKEQDDTVAEFRRQAADRRGHPAYGHHLVPLVDDNDEVIGNACWYCGKNGDIIDSMGFKKYQSTEKTEVVSPQGHLAIQSELSKVGKTSAKELSDAERAEVRPLDKQ